MTRFHWVLAGLLIVVLGSGITLLWPNTGPIVGFAAVGKDPWPLVIDAKTARAFVYNRTDGTVSTIDTVTGALVHTALAGSQFAFMTVDRRTSRVFASSGGDDTIYTLDARTGVVLHAVRDTDVTTRQPAMDEASNHVFVGHRDVPTITMLDARTGAIIRHIPACDGSFALAASVRTGHIFAKCNDGTTDMLDARTGRVLRTIPISVGSFGYVFVDEHTNRVFSCSNDNTNAIDVVDARTGAHLYTIAGVNAVNPPTVDERTGRVYAALGGPGIPSASVTTSQIAVLDGWTGRVLRRIKVADNPTVVAVNSRTGHILVASVGAVNSSSQPTGFGVLSVLNGASGALLRRVSIGIFPADMAIDPVARRLLVDNETVDLNDFSTGFSGALTTSPPETGWARTRRQALRFIKSALPSWFPFKVMVPPPPSPPTNGTVTTLDLASL
jgi:DNA-binding beta-propeller fold protein YncE